MLAPHQQEVDSDSGGKKIDPMLLIWPRKLEEAFVRFQTSLLPNCLLISCLCTVAVFAQSLDGVWAGSLTCSENVANRNPGYTGSIELQIAGKTGRFERMVSQTQVKYSLQMQPSGAIELQSTGRLRNDNTPRWTTRLAG